jgi:hypothetical protein
LDCSPALGPLVDWSSPRLSWRCDTGAPSPAWLVERPVVCCRPPPLRGPPRHRAPLRPVGSLRPSPPAALHARERRTHRPASITPTTAREWMTCCTKPSSPTLWSAARRAVRRGMQRWACQRAEGLAGPMKAAGVVAGARIEVRLTRACAATRWVAGCLPCAHRPLTRARHRSQGYSPSGLPSPRSPRAPSRRWPPGPP